MADFGLTSVCDQCRLSPADKKIIYSFNLPTDPSQNAARIANEIFEETDIKGDYPTEIIWNQSLSRAGKEVSIYMECIPLRKNPSTGKIERLVRFEVQKLAKTSQALSKKSTHAAANSALESGDWYKIYIKKSGVYQLNYDFITKNLKIDATSFNLSNCGIFGYSNGMKPTIVGESKYDDLPENSIKVIDNNGNDKFDAGDFILFYAQGNMKWTLQSDQLFRHESHLYSDSSAYFFTTNRGKGSRVQDLNNTNTPAATINTFQDYFAIEQDKTNLIKTGRVWLGDMFTSSSNSKSYPINFANIDNTKQVNFSTLLAGYSAVSNSSVGIGVDANSLVTVNITPTEELTASSNFEIWNVTDIASVKKVITSASGNIHRFNFSNQVLQEFVVFESSQTLIPTAGQKIANQNIHGLSPAAFLIVSPNAFLSAANKLANLHREKDGMTVHVLPLESVYNEFSSGTKDITALRDLSKLFYDRGASNPNLQLKNILLMGDASFNYKSLDDFVPTYESVESFDGGESYNTDDYLTYLDDGEGGIDILNHTITNKADIGVGRIPCKSLAEAFASVDKIVRYKDAVGYRDWRNKVTVVADDADNTTDYIFQAQCDDYISKPIQDSFPAFNVDKVYLDAFKQESSAGGNRYPDAQKALLDKINQGCLAITYIGHGGPTNWAQERLFGNSEILALKNIDNLPFFVTATCDFSPFDDPSFQSAGENLVINPKGGAVSILSTTRLVYISDNGQLVQDLFEGFFDKIDGKYQTLGEIARRAKNQQPRNPNARKFVLLGDPALTLNFPENNIVTTQISGNPISGNDTLKALQKVTIRGEVRNNQNQIIQNFNGICYPTIFDKASTIRTLNNDRQAQEYEFISQQNTIFKGRASVVNGAFEFSFIVPKDIDYNIGKGKMSYYAENASQGGNMDANGYNKDFYVGSTDENYASDSKGPEVKLYMNDANFALGGITNENPAIFAMLSDENGINTVGNGVGHDITAIIDEKTQNAISLNNFYESALDDYTKGNVRYNLSKLSEGKHTLKLKAWDVHNNPGEGYTEFIVAKNASIAIKHLLNYPNPFTTNTCFQFEHNKAGELLDITIQIYTISGKIVKNLYQKIQATSYRMNREICWDGLDEYGDAIGRGVYIYKVFLRDEQGNSIADVQKLVLLR
ncbi:MAG: type IX secretion system sortase PorU [Bacteroidetes bacterium]|nr:type IX secretion system sortase PorU [Bacteroidota bacterium]